MCPPISITTDYDGDSRYNNIGYPVCISYSPAAPDIGADEFGGINLDLTPPTISYSPLTNTTSTSNRSFTGVTITDAGSGVNITPGTRPRCYYKKLLDANTIVDNTSSTNGWKYAEANGTGGSPFDFTIDYSLLYGGSVTTGDVIQYFVIAQDNASTPNVAVNSGTLASPPTSVSLSSSNCPITGSINQYGIISSGMLSGDYTVGLSMFNRLTGKNLIPVKNANGSELSENGKLYTGSKYVVYSKEDKLKYGLPDNLVGNYSTITAALNDLNTNGISGNVRFLLLDAVYGPSGTPESFPLTINQVTGAGPSATIKILPYTGVTSVISSDNTSAILLLNGADYITIDGRPNETGTPKSLTIRNTNSSTSATTVTFINDATYNTLQYTVFEGAGANTAFPPTASTIYFSITTGSTGNDYNVVQYNDIRDRTDGTGYQHYGVASTGTTTSTATYNSNIQVLNNNIFNFFEDSFTGSAAIILGSGSTDWTITGNSCYQTATRNTTIGVAWNVIMVNNSLSNNNVITNNYIGGSAPMCGGVPWTTGGTGRNSLLCLRVFGGSTTASSIQGNTIANIDQTTTPTASGSGWFIGIYVQTGIANVGDITSNTVGSGTGNDNIKVTMAGSGAFTTFVYGIRNDYAGNGHLQNNTVGSITLSGTTTGTLTFYAMYRGGSSAVFASAQNITNNLIGSNSTANSIQCTSSGLPAVMYGLYCNTGTTGAGLNISNNTFSNITNQSTQAAARIAGMFLFEIGGNSPTAGITSNNTLSEFNAASTNVGTTPSGCAVIGMYLDDLAPGRVMNGNVIRGMRSTTTSASNTVVMGIGNDYSWSGTMSGNRIYDLTNTSTGTAPQIIGIYTSLGTVTCSNSQVALTNGEATDNPTNKVSTNSNTNNYSVSTNTVVNNYVPQNNELSTSELTSEANENAQDNTKPGKDNINRNAIPQSDASTNGLQIQGITYAGGTWNYYYNSVYIGGSQSAGSANSFAFYKTTTSTVNLVDNLLFNARTNTGAATGTHYAVGNTSATGWSSSASNYNVFVSPNASTVGQWVLVDQSISQWRTSSGGDVQTWSTSSGSISVSNLFSSISAGNLNIQTGNSEAWLVSGKGIAVTGQSTDFNGNVRVTSVSGGCTDIGSHEFTATPPNNPVATESAPPAPGTTTSYTLWGRTICSIIWGTGGTNYPTGMNVKYYPGINPSNALGGNYGNSYWNISIGSGSFDGKYNVILNFGDNETYTIGTPSSNSILSKYESWGAWQVYPLYISGPTDWQSQLNWANKTIRVDSLQTFSDFALTDNTSPLPVMLSSFEAPIVKHDVNLTWVTEHEINNRGFYVEKRAQVSGNLKEQYSNWTSVNSEIINGAGTTNNRQRYSYFDKKLAVGKYQYRLKQVDYNGNFEYYELNNPRDVIVGKPMDFDISQNYPNPSNPKSKIDYQLPFNGKVSIKVYDMLGREIAILVDEIKEAGYYTAEFDGTNLASGPYFYRIIAENGGQKFVKTLKLILVK